MHVGFILPALTEARGMHRRPIKYSLFPPLGLATLAGYLDASDEAEIVDEHVEDIRLDDEPDLVAIEVYVTSAFRAYHIADEYRRRGVHVVLGGLHPTACPDEAARHADTVVLGPAEEAWPRFLSDFRRGCAASVYRSRYRELASLPSLRRDLIRRADYLVPNSIAVSRGCPHRCGFCYSNSFFRGGRRFYTVQVHRALDEIQRLQGRHLFFLDDNILGDPQFAASLFRGMRDMNRVWQGAATVRSVLDRDLLDLAVESGLRSLFIGFETLNQGEMHRHGKLHNRVADYEKAIALLHERGVMINGSFVFGVDGDDASVFAATTEWAIAHGVETATFHILTPYPGTDLFKQYAASGRIRHRDWNLYDTRHVVFDHPRMAADVLEKGYWSAYDAFYRWESIARASLCKDTLLDTVRQVAYVAAWKKLDPLWSLLIGLRKLQIAIPPLEAVLKGRNRASNRSQERTDQDTVKELRSKESS